MENKKVSLYYKGGYPTFECDSISLPVAPYVGMELAIWHPDNKLPITVFIHRVIYDFDKTFSFSHILVHATDTPYTNR